MKWDSRYLVLLGIGVLLFVIFYFFSAITGYILLAWVVSLIGQPIMRFLLTKLHFNRLRFGNGLAAMVTLTTFFVVAFLLVYLFVPILIKQATNLANMDYQSVLASLQEPINNVNDWLHSYRLISAEDTIETELGSAIAKYFQPGLISDVASSIVETAGSVLVAVFSIAFIAFFFLKDQSLFTSALVAIFPNEYEGPLVHGLGTISRLLTRYFGGILIQMSIITVIIFIGLTFLGVENALLIGFFAALLNVIPYVGPIIGAAFAVLLTLSQTGAQSGMEFEFYNELLPLLLSILGVFAVMQLTDNFLIQPYIFSNSVNAHPLEIFIVVLVGAKVNGITGMVLAIPTYTILRVMAKVFLSEFRIVQKLTKSIQNE